MVITRSGTTVRQHAVRFKKGADVRRVLEYDEDDWGFREMNYNENNAATNDIAGHPIKVTPNGSIIMNGHAHGFPLCNDNLSQSTESSVKEVQSSHDITIPYDVGERKGCSWLWDALLFAIVTLSCYSSAFILYTFWGHKLYLALTTLCIMIFSYNITYFDSTQPGIMPPSPISPTIYKRMSGHSYHLTYMMSIINGLVFLAVEPYIRGVVVPPV